MLENLFVVLLGGLGYFVDRFPSDRTQTNVNVSYLTRWFSCPQVLQIVIVVAYTCYIVKAALALRKVAFDYNYAYVATGKEAGNYRQSLVDYYDSIGGRIEDIVSVY